MSKDVAPLDIVEAARVIALALALKYNEQHPSPRTWLEAKRLAPQLKHQGHVKPRPVYP